MTTEEARQYFADWGLTYEKLKDYDIYLLMYFIDDEFFKQRDKFSMSYMKLNRNPEISRGKTGLRYAYLTVKSDYFDNREAISFNKDGFIGFAGWSDKVNIQAFIKAFLRWCDFIAINLEVENLELEDENDN
ncbi:hypothetical protein HB884_05150 [Listeria booriae]|uniref:hypothetical protein n=1 Tax=Listeria booriae TaxID=1552123 RepID=UPI001625DA1F|nr:hypothetical protein [Listeria booriae]MBC1523591.1 hypothetical protein [Listeria booriae]